MTLKRVLLFLGAFAVAFVLGWVIVPTVFVNNASEQPAKTFDLTYEYSPVDAYCATDLMKTPDSDIEYVSAAGAQGANDLIWTGSFPSEQITFKSGETWLGLFREGGKYTVRQTKVNIARSKTSGELPVEVSTDRSGRSLFLVRNMPYLREGEIISVWDEETTEQALMPLTFGPRTFELAGKSYTFTVEAQQDGRLINGSKLVLTVGKDRQVLRTLDTDCSDCAWNILWAGDLDRDSKLDFLMDLPSEANTTEKVLFLSSQPTGGKLVKAVASFRQPLTQ